MKNNIIKILLAIFILLLIPNKNVYAASSNRDCNNDGLIDMKDLGIIAKLYNIDSTLKTWNARYDLNRDEIIDLYDLVLLSTDLNMPIIEQEYPTGKGIVSANGWIYYVDKTSENRGVCNLYKIKEDGSNKKLLSDRAYQVPQLWLVGDWIYYLSLDALCRVKIDGTNDETISSCGEAKIKDENIYLTKWKVNKYELWKTDLDGKNEKLINDGSQGSIFLNNISIYNDWIYFTPGNFTGLWKQKIDGTELSKISVYFFNGRYSIFYNGFLYEATSSDGIIKSSLDGTFNKKITNSFTSLMLPKENYIYYFDDLGDYELHRMCVDGSDDKIISASFLNQFSFDEISISDSWVYTFDINDYSKIKRVKVDGSKQEIINLK